MATQLHLATATAVSLFVSLSLLLSSPSVVSNPDLQIANAERRIDLTSHIIKVFLTLKVENAGTSPASEVLLAFPPTQVDHLALLKAAVVGGKKKESTYTSVDVNPKLPDGPTGTKYFSIALLNPLKAGEAIALEVLYILTHSLEPFPSEISQYESQLVYFRDTAIILSPYHIKQQTTFMRTPTTKVESFTAVEPTSRTGLELKYGPYNDQPPHSFSAIIVHFENNQPFFVVEELVREFDVSHRSSIAVKEFYTLVHAGARLKGVFSRVDNQCRPFASGVALKRLLVRLPPRAHSVFCRDETGSISTSFLRMNSKNSELGIEPRYSLFGGWKWTFVVGYSLPLHDFRYQLSDGRRYLNFTFGCSMVEAVVDKLTIKVALPEGTRNPTVMVPFPVEQRRETTFSSVDIRRRIVLVLEKMSTLPEQSFPFQVYYEFIPPSMLVGQFIVNYLLLLSFLAFIAYLCFRLAFLCIKLLIHVSKRPVFYFFGIIFQLVIRPRIKQENMRSNATNNNLNNDFSGNAQKQDQ